jgi:hypothetical protein
LLAKFIASLLLVLALVPASLAARTLDVVYPRIEERPPDDYGFAVLQLALAKSGVDYRLRLSDVKMNQERARSEMAQGRISVVDCGTSAEFEARFRTVWFPIDRGLSGYRLAIIHPSRADAFARVRSIEQLRRQVAGQGPGWSDTSVLRAAGVEVETAEFEQLFRMVDAERFDFYPLGVEEVYGLLDRYRHLAPHAVVEPTMAIHYPFARLFFVNKNDAALQEALTRGLQRAFADGSFQHLFENHRLVKASLQRARMKERVIIEIDNPLLTPAFRLMPAHYFYRP